MARYDVLIKNGTVFDGKGNKPEAVDVAIAGDEIKKIGDLKNDSANKIIDATDKYVAPGFIDLTNHSDTHWTLFTYPSQESLLRQGITTILGGNCGTSLAPFVGESSIKEIERWIDVSRININWQTMEEFLSQLENTKIGLNFATLVGLNTTQRTVNNDIKQMKFLLQSSLAEGAFGISANLGLYPVKSLLDEEIIDLFSTNAIRGENILTKHHLEDEGENFLPAVSRLISLARKSGAKVHFSHFKSLGKNSWRFFSEAIEMIKRARDEGLKLSCDFFPYTRTGSSLFALFPSWLRKLSNKEVLETMRSKRKDLITHLKDLTLHYDKIIVASASSELNVVGKTIEQLSRISGLSGEEIILNLLETNNLRVSIFNEVISPENIELISKEEFSVIASDGVGYELGNRISNGNPISPSDLPHPRSFGAFPKAFNLLVKEKTISSWEEIIYKMSGLAADILGLKERGTIEESKKADIVIFDPKEISDRATYEEPLQYSQGVESVLINGKLVVDNGVFTGQLPGRVLRKK